MSLEEELENLMNKKPPNFNPTGPPVKKRFYRQDYGRSEMFHGQQYEFEFIAREEWGAVKPLHQDIFPEIVKRVVIGFTDTEECHNVMECIMVVNNLQKKHMQECEPDIKHNFMIGGDGQVYEGRGWHVRPPAAEEWTECAKTSINVAYIGMKGHFPPKPLAKIAMQLVDFGITNFCLQQDDVGVAFDYFDEHHDILAEMEKNPDYNKNEDDEKREHETTHL